MGQGWREVNRNSAIGMDPNGLVPEALPSPPLAPKERRLACHLVCQIASSMPASSRCRRVFSRRVPPRTAWATPASRSLASRPLSLQVLQALTLHGVLVGAVIAKRSRRGRRPSCLAASRSRSSKTLRSGALWTGSFRFASMVAAVSRSAKWRRWFRLASLQASFEVFVAQPAHRAEHSFVSTCFRRRQLEIRERNKEATGYLICSGGSHDYIEAKRRSPLRNSLKAVVRGGVRISHRTWLHE